MTGEGTPVLEVRGLGVSFRTRRGTVAALRDIDLQVAPGQVQVVVGESGSGKSVLAHSLLGLLPRNVEVSGSVRLEGEDLLGVAPERMRQLRAQHLAYVPQSPATSLNPVRRTASLMAEAARVKGVRRADLGERLPAVGAAVGLDYGSVARRYPHQLSGGMQQRVVNALALLGKPDLVVADEPTTGLDRDRVTATGNELLRLADEGASVLVITHDLDLAAALGGRTAVLYGGRLVEERPTAALFTRPAHPYTAALLAAMPARGLHPIPGQPPELTDPPPGCPFAPRCERVRPECGEQVPAATTLPDGRVWCHAAR